MFPPLVICHPIDRIVFCMTCLGTAHCLETGRSIIRQTITDPALVINHNYPQLGIFAFHSEASTVRE